MSQETSVQLENEPAVKLPPPELVEPDEEENEEPDLKSLQNYAVLGELTQTQRTVLVALVTNTLRDDTHSESKIAEDIGICRDTIRACRMNRTFANAMSMMMREVIAGRSDVIVNNLFNLAEKSVKANEILARIAEVYQPMSRNINLNANMAANPNTPRSPEEALDRHITAFIALGYDEERLLNETSARFQALKAAGLR